MDWPKIQDVAIYLSFLTRNIKGEEEPGVFIADIFTGHGAKGIQDLSNYQAIFSINFSKENKIICKE